MYQKEIMDTLKDVKLEEIEKRKMLSRNKNYMFKEILDRALKY